MVTTPSTRAPIPTWTQARSAIGVAARRGTKADMDAARSAFAAARIADFIKRMAEASPPLDPDHVAALHTILDATQAER